MKNSTYDILVQIPWYLKPRLDKMVENSGAKSKEIFFRRMLAITETVLEHLNEGKVLVVADESFVNSEACPQGSVTVISTDPKQG